MTELDDRIRRIFDAPSPVSIEEIRDLHRRRARSAETKRRLRLPLAVALVVCAVLISGGALYILNGSSNRPVTVAVGGSTPTKSHTTTLPASPLAGRSGAATTWTGKQMLVWGGRAPTGSALGDGASYTPATGKWQILPRSPLGPRFDAFSTWTGREWIVWGGFTGVGKGGKGPFAGNGNGASYVPATGRWTMLPAAPRSLLDPQAEVWTGREMILVSSFGGNAAVAYSPASKRWTRLAAPPAAPSTAAAPSQNAVWTGQQAVFLMRKGNGNARTGQFLATYNPATNTWSRTSGGHIPTRTVPILVWDGQDVLLLGDQSWNPTTRKWTKLSPAPSDVSHLDSGQTAIWTGTLVLLWGPTPHPLAFDPANNRWSTFNGGASPGRRFASVVWTGHTLLGWGGQDSNTPNQVLDTGISYTP